MKTEGVLELRFNNVTSQLKLFVLDANQEKNAKKKKCVCRRGEGRGGEPSTGINWEALNPAMEFLGSHLGASTPDSRVPARRSEARTVSHRHLAGTCENALLVPKDPKGSWSLPKGVS